MRRRRNRKDMSDGRDSLCLRKLLHTVQLFSSPRLSIPSSPIYIFLSHVALHPTLCTHPFRLPPLPNLSLPPVSIPSTPHHHLTPYLSFPLSLSLSLSLSLFISFTFPLISFLLFTTVLSFSSRPDLFLVSFPPPHLSSPISYLHLPFTLTPSCQEPKYATERYT